MARREMTPRHWYIMVLALVLTASSCTGSATVTQSSSDGESTEPAAETSTQPGQSEAPDPDPGAAPDEPTAPPQGSTTPEPSATPEPSGSDRRDFTELPASAFVDGMIVGLSGSGAFGYAGTTSPWLDPTSCEAEVTQALAVADIAAAARGSLTVAAAGLEQAGDVRQMLTGPDGAAIVLSSCQGAAGETQVWMQQIRFDADGFVESVGNRVDLGGPAESEPYLERWVDADTIEARVIIETDPDDAATWILERRRVDVATGQVVGVEQIDLYDEDAFSSHRTWTTPQGVVYTAVDDPAGRLGCEGFGVARTLEVATGSDRRLALTQPDMVFSDIVNLHTSPTGHIAWTSGCEGYVSAFVGKILDDGSIADPHLVDTFAVPGSDFAEYQHYRLTTDGHLNAVGLTYAGESDPEPAFLHYDLTADPHFVNTASPAPAIDSQPLFDAIEGGSWHVGDTLATDPACGGRTLYGKTPGGFVRAFPTGIEIDEIVDVDLGQVHRIVYPDSDFVSRTVVVQTECPGSYEGRRVWFGLESDQIIWGLGLDRADMGEVADVLSVRDIVDEQSDFVEMTIVQVELLDGTVAEFELVPLPFTD